MHDRRTIRMPGYDYAGIGAYFVTICTFEKEHIFGSVRNGEMILNRSGAIVHDEWLQTAVVRPDVRLDEFVVMPNHFHAVIWIAGDACRGTARRAPTKQYRTPIPEQFGKPVSGSIPTIIRSFKSAVTKRVRLSAGARDQVWQRNYHEHVIRDEGTLCAIRRYIRDNPSNWSKDEYAT